MMRVAALLLFISQALGFALDTKLDLPIPTLAKKSGVVESLDSSLSPKLVKAFYEINFVPIDEKRKESNAERSNFSNGVAMVSDSTPCPYSKDLCRFYFVPSRVNVVQKVEDIIDNSKKDGQIPVLQGLVTRIDEEKFLKEMNDSILADVNKVVNITSTGTEVPIYRGTVNVDEVLKRPEFTKPIQIHFPHWIHGRSRRIGGPCIYGPCYSSEWPDHQFHVVRY